MIKDKIKNILKILGIFKIVSFFYYILLKLIKRINNKFSNNGYILLYHRVDDLRSDSNLLAVSPKNFEEQIKFLKENYNVISLEKMIADIKLKKVQNNSVVVTFDDGYLDNYSNALNILEKYKVHVTIFVTAGKVGDTTQFDWDEGNSFDDNSRCMNEIEIKQISKSRFVEIGSHTVFHKRLNIIDGIEVRQEIFDSKIMLEKVLDKNISFFSYPFGGYTIKNDSMVKLVKEAGYKAACENIPSCVNNNSDIFRLPRFVVRDWNSAEFKEKIKNFI